MYIYITWKGVSILTLSSVKKSQFDQLEKEEKKEIEELVLHKQGTNLEIETLQMNEGLVDKRDRITKKDETIEEMIDGGNTTIRILKITITTIGFV
tara:strand:+ start:218 stop:505 length:288 start_codon:yes stop_codon:yes gene_type:complete